MTDETAQDAIRWLSEALRHPIEPPELRAMPAAVLLAAPRSIAHAANCVAPWLRDGPELDWLSGRDGTVVVRCRRCERFGVVARDGAITLPDAEAEPAMAAAERIVAALVEWSGSWPPTQDDFGRNSAVGEERWIRAQLRAAGKTWAWAKAEAQRRRL